MNNQCSNWILSGTLTTKPRPFNRLSNTVKTRSLGSELNLLVLGQNYRSKGKKSKKSVTLPKDYIRRKTRAFNLKIDGQTKEPIVRE